MLDLRHVSVGQTSLYWHSDFKQQENRNNLDILAESRFEMFSQYKVEFDRRFSGGAQPLPAAPLSIEVSEAEPSKYISKLGQICLARTTGVINKISC